MTLCISLNWDTLFTQKCSTPIKWVAMFFFYHRIEILIKIGVKSEKIKLYIYILYLLKTGNIVRNCLLLPAWYVDTPAAASDVAQCMELLDISIQSDNCVSVPGPHKPHYCTSVFITWTKYLILAAGKLSAWWQLHDIHDRAKIWTLQNHVFLDSWKKRF